MSDETKTDSKVTTVTTITKDVSAGAARRVDVHVEKVLQVVGTPQAAVDVAPVSPAGGEPKASQATEAKIATVAKVISLEATFGSNKPAAQSSDNTK